MSGHPGSLLFYVWAALFAAAVVAVFGLNLRAWKRNAPLREQGRARPITFRTDLSWVNFPDVARWRGGGRPRRRVQLIIRGDLVQVGVPFGPTA